MQSKWISLLLIAAGTLVLAGCQSAASAASTPAAVPAPAQIIVQGHIEPVQYTELSFLSAGQVAEVLVEEGDAVAAGQVIARLAGEEAGLADLTRAEQEVLAAEQALKDLRAGSFSSAAQARAMVADAEKAVADAKEQLETLIDADADAVDIEQAEAQLALARANHWDAKNQAGNLNQGIDPDMEASLAAQLNTAKTSRIRAQAALDNLALRAPSDGVISSLQIIAGQFIPVGQAAATLADLSGWVVKTDDLTELEVVEIEVGQPVTIILDALAGAPMAGKVTWIASQYEEKRGDVTYTVTIAVENPNPAARWGMTGQVIFEQGD